MQNNNGLTNEQNEAAIAAIGRLKVHDLSAIISQLNLRRPRANKNEQQKALYSALLDPSSAATIYQMAISMANGNYEMSKRAHQQPRAAPYTLPGQRNGFVNVNNTNLMMSSLMNPVFAQQQHMMHQQQQHRHHQESQQPRRAPPFEIVPLPFYDVIETLLHPCELPAVHNGAKITKQVSFNFTIAPDQSQKLGYRDSTPLPRHEVQLRFFNLTEAHGPQKDDFPLNAFVRINENVVNLPNVIPTNRPNVEPKRPSRPVNVTGYVSRFGNGTSRLSVEWLGDKRTWACVVYYVLRVDSKILFNRVDQSLHKHRLIEDTKKEVISKLKGGEDDIAMDRLTISLLDPLVKTRMVTPARCSDCTHLQCFDLMSYLMMNEKKPTWTCPVCSGYCPYDKLIVDDYFRDMLEKVDSNTTEVELKEDGTYDVLTIDDFECLTDSDDEKKPTCLLNGPTSSSTTNGSSNPPPAENGGKKKKAPVVDDEIITLSDDDDDSRLKQGIQNSLNDLTLCAVQYAAPADSTVPRTPPRSTNPPPTNGAVRKTQSADIEIITLDDTPPRPQQQQHQPPSLLRMPSMTTSSGPSSASIGNGMTNLNDALAQIGNGGPPRSQPSQQQLQQPSTSSSSSQMPSNSSSMMSSHQLPYMQALNAANPSYSYPGMMTQPFQMQNGLIGRQNQMAPQMGQSQQSNNGQMLGSPQYYQSQAMNGFQFPPYGYQPQYRQN